MPRALELQLVLPDFSFRQGVVLVGAAISDGVEVVADTYERDAQPTHVEPACIAALDLFDSAEHQSISHRHANPPLVENPPIGAGDPEPTGSAPGRLCDRRTPGRSASPRAREKHRATRCSSAGPRQSAQRSTRGCN